MRPEDCPERVKCAEYQENAAQCEAEGILSDDLYPTAKYLELFSRCKEKRKGWVFWGDEQ
jgi:N6-adenosine-specific RNA methylase IME4